MTLNRHFLKSLCLAGAAIAWLTGCESGNHQNLAANQAVSVDAQPCGSRAHGEYWFELTDQTSTNDTYVCPNGSLGSSIHFLEAQFQCEQGQVIATGTTRLDPDPISTNCSANGGGGGTTPNPNPMPPPTPQVCSPGATQSCSIANGSGQQTCNAAGSEWNDCQVTSCNTNFVQSGNRCIQNTFTGSGLFHCDASFCDVTCGTNTRPDRLYRGEKGFCTTTPPSNNLRGSNNSNPYKGFHAWIQADYNLHGSFVKAESSTVRVKITCDVNLYRTGISSWYNFGVRECFYEATGLTQNPIRRSIWMNRSAQPGVTRSGQALNLNQANFYPFQQLTKHTNHMDYGEDGPVTAATYWHNNARTNSDRGDTVIDLEIRANMSYRATKH